MVCYIAALAYVCFFSEQYGRTIISTEYRYNLTPFKEIRRFYEYMNVVGLESFIVNLFGNVLVFIPFGFILPVMRIKRRKFFYTVFATFLLSLCIETIQLVFRVGAFDVDDLILNTLGGMIGVCIYFVANIVRRKSFA